MDDESFQNSGWRALAQQNAEEVMRLQQKVRRLEGDIARSVHRAAEKERQMNMSGKLKKLLAILAALGITASGAIQFLGHVTAAFPHNAKVSAACSALSTIIGLLVAIYPVSVKLPDDSPDKKPAMDVKP